MTPAEGKQKILDALKLWMDTDGTIAFKVTRNRVPVAGQKVDFFSVSIEQGVAQIGIPVEEPLIVPAHANGTPKVL
jgi:hypothetical protein